MLQVIFENVEPTQLLFNGLVTFLEVGDPVFEEFDEFVMRLQILGGVSNDGEVVGSSETEGDRCSR